VETIIKYPIRKGKVQN